VDSGNYNYVVLFCICDPYRIEKFQEQSLFLHSSGHFNNRIPTIRHLRLVVKENLGIASGGSVQRKKSRSSPIATQFLGLLNSESVKVALNCRSPLAPPMSKSASLASLASPQRIRFIFNRDGCDGCDGCDAF
jgi:hypothetical protein